jgi:hypothetical protein
MRPIHSGTPLGHFHKAPSIQGLKKHEQVADPVAFVLRVVPFSLKSSSFNN